jgi:hypothetical protein
MKKVLLLCLHTLLFASLPDPELDLYQKRYSVCHGKTNYQIAKCLLNGDLDYSRFRGDRHAYRKIPLRAIREAVYRGDIYVFTLSNLPKTERYLGLKSYLDYLYTIEDIFLPPEFKGDEVEDTLRIKRLFNLLLHAGLEETPERTPLFEEALLEYQRRHGLAVDGEIGPRTRRALQQPIGRIIEKVKKNLMLEALSLPKPPTDVLVNIPEFKMHYYENGIPALEMKIVVGKPKMRTPIFNRNMKFIVENPNWNVPPSIYTKEYAHKTEAELRKLGLRYNKEGKLYQPSGRRNALGVVKFLFPNKFNVYMHDTPAKSLFQRSRRAYSHGCIRLERPLDLLHKLGYTYHPGKIQWITLDEEIPVFVEYHTVWVDDEGIVQFRPDIYGYEKKLFH